MSLVTIGTVRTPRTDPDDTVGWGDVTARIELVPELGDASLTGLVDFSHVEVLFRFHLAEDREHYRGVRPARGRADLPPIGVFAARGPYRPNRIGVSSCRLVEVGDTWLTVRGLDAVDGTPVLDLKPVMSALLPTDVHEPAWSRELMADYWQR